VSDDNRANRRDWKCHVSRSSKKPTGKVKSMDGAHNGRRYKAGDTVKLEIVLHHRANLREVRVVFEHTRNKSVAPLIARGRPRPIPERGSDGSMRSRLEVEIVIPGTLTPRCL
jgi:hypothetical protein